MSRFRIDVDGIPDEWTLVYESPFNSKNNVSIETVGFTNADSTKTVIQLRIVGDFQLSGPNTECVTLTRELKDDSQFTLQPAILLRPGDRLEVICDKATAVADMYCVGERHLKYNTWGNALRPALQDTPLLIYEMPDNAGHGLTVHAIVASRVGGGGQREVDVYVEKADASIITLLTGIIPAEDFIFIITDMIIERGDKIYGFSSRNDIIDVVLIYERSDALKGGY